MSTVVHFKEASSFLFEDLICYETKHTQKYPTNIYISFSEKAKEKRVRGTTGWDQFYKV